MIFASEMHSDLDKISKESPKMFILISTVLTWAHTKVDDVRIFCFQSKNVKVSLKTS